MDNILFKLLGVIVMRPVLCIVILIFSLNVFSEDTLYLGLISSHHNDCRNCDSGQWNESHNLIGYSNSKYFVGYMKNSYNRDSYILGKSFINTDYTYVTPYAMLGVATGYKGKTMVGLGSLTLTPYLAVEIHTADKKYGINLVTIPGEVVAIGFRLGF